MIEGEYRREPARFFLDPESRVVVITEPDGTYKSGWRLNPQQLVHVVRDHRLGGG